MSDDDLNSGKMMVSAKYTRGFMPNSEKNIEKYLIAIAGCCFLLVLLLFRCIKLANFQSASISIASAPLLADAAAPGLLCMPNFKI